MRVLKIAGAALAAILLVIVLLMVVGIPSSFVAATIRDHVERATGYRLTVAGATRISLWPRLNLTLHDITLQDPRDRDGTNRITIGSIEAEMPVSSAWSGKPVISELTITRPVLYVPLLRNREAAAASKPGKPADEAEAVAVDRIKVINGTIVFSNVHDRVENRIDGIEAEATIGADQKLKVAGSARAGSWPVKFDVSAIAPQPPIERQNIPVDIHIDAPELLHAPLAAKAELRLAGPLIRFNGVSGTLGDGSFSGWASVEAASKPLVKLDLDFQRLDIPVAKTPPGAAAQASTQAWSNAPFDLTGLNYIDAQVRISAAEMSLGSAQFAPAAIEATLAGGILKTAVANLGAYGGQANGEMIVDATAPNPTFAMHCDLVNVGALPLLTSLVDFDKIEGHLQAKIAARSAGNSQQAIMSNMSGTVFANFQDGAIRGINVAQMIRNLTASTLTGWQEDPTKEQSTDLSQLSASFRIDRGQAQTTDLNLVGPLVKVTGTGTIDLPTRQIGFRVEPKLVLTTQGQGRTSDPVGFGIPVMISGPWSEPRIYPDMAGVLDNPDAAYAKLREMGKGLFGPNGGLNGIISGLSGLAGGGQTSGTGGADNGQGNLLGGQLGQTLGNLIQQGLGATQQGGEPGTPRRNRAIPPNPTPQGQAAPQQDGSSSQTQGQQNNQQDGPQDSAPMNDVLRQLFNR
ncbi:MAG TPA: AsmA family protein [Bradyrhizobium sp.]|nr:AsmA family protein [Bradyrhizobium sp.]